MTRPLSVGIVGYGVATKVFHAPLLAGVPGLRLAAIASSDPAKVAADGPKYRWWRARRRFSHAPTSTSW